ncbi:hypothetical protein X279_08070 [Oenococcus oeni IOEB_0501]|nr:hypothetical protein X279_08070 [Oenococcus oeni IOEB_0501]
MKRIVQIMPCDKQNVNQKFKKRIFFIEYFLKRRQKEKKKQIKKRHQSVLKSKNL